MTVDSQRNAEKTWTVGDCDFHPLTADMLRAHIVSCLQSGVGGMLVTANLDHLVRYHRDPSYRSLVERADVVVADGMPIIWASRLRKTPLPERIAGSTLSISLSEQLAKSGHKLFLLGGNPGVAEKAAGILQGRFPGLIIAGIYSPPFGFEKDPEQMAAIRNMLHDSRPDVVYVALGSPKQEILADQLRAEFPHVWWMGVGISLSFIAGDIHRAPVLLQRLGLEWIHRMAQEPRRLAKRYLIDGIPFGLWLMASSAAERVRRVFDHR